MLKKPYNQGMKIAILGAGFAGMAAAYDLIQAGHAVTIYEKAPRAGGAAGGFKLPHWDWHLDFAYHHLFTSDADIVAFCKEIGWDAFITKNPITASSYDFHLSPTLKPQQVYKLDSPLDLLRFPQLSLFDRLRAGMVLAALKFGPAVPYYHTYTSYQLISQLMGESAWNTLWEPLFSHKYGEYAHQINAMFFWARIHTRTPNLRYPAGGFQALADYTASYLQHMGVVFNFNYTVSSMRKDKKNTFIINEKNRYDAIISTLPSPVFLAIEKGVLPASYRKRLEGIRYLGAHAVIYETKKPLVKDVYWLSIADPSNPWMVLVQHTNFMDPRHFGGNHIAYLARYTNEKLPTIPLPQYAIQNHFIPYAQPLYTTDYTSHMPHTSPPVPSLYFANMELTYPYDRGTNYAVQVGRKAAQAVIEGARERT